MARRVPENATGPEDTGAIIAMTTAPTIETERTILRAHRLDEFEAYAAMWADPVVTRFIGGKARTREESWIRFLRHPGMWSHDRLRLLGDRGKGVWPLHRRSGLPRPQARPRSLYRRHAGGRMGACPGRARQGHRHRSGRRLPRLGEGPGRASKGPSASSTRTMLRRWRSRTSSATAKRCEPPITTARRSCSNADCTRDGSLLPSRLSIILHIIQPLG